MSNLPQRQAQAPQNGRTAAQTPAPVNEIDLIELLMRLLAGWKLIVCLSLAFAIAAGVYANHTTVPVYQATSVIYILSRESAINLSDLSLSAALAQDYIKIFDMWELNAEVVSRLNLPYSYGALRGMVSIRNTAGTHMLDITATSTSPDLAAAIANAYAEVASQYIADTMLTEKPTIMSVALVPTRPINGSNTKKVMTGFMVGLALAVAWITLRMLLDDKYKTSEDIRKYTGLVTLAVVPTDDAFAARKAKEKHGR